jgi:hypothetical protein
MTDFRQLTGARPLDTRLLTSSLWTTLDLVLLQRDV